MFNQTNAACDVAGASPVPELGHLKAAAERLAIAAEAIEKFNARFFGSNPGTNDAAEKLSESTYRNDLNSVFQQIGRIEAAACTLTQIG